MPHSESDVTAAVPDMNQMNGEAPSSAFLSHLISYPVINDSIETFKSNPYGKKSLEVGSTGYERLAKPFFPYLQKPYEYVSPYVKKADSLGDSTLSSIDSKFPAVKKPTGELYDNGKSIVFFPLKKGSEGKEYVFKTYDSEVKKVGGGGVVGYGKAAVTTGLIVGSDALSWLSGFLMKKKEQTKEVANEKMNG